MELITAIQSRRTVKIFSGAAVPRDLLMRLIEAAAWAPNHRLTQPWRFAVADRAGVGRLVAMVQQPPVSLAVEPRKLPAIVERLQNCGAVIQVTCHQEGDVERRREDRDATAAAVQNLLLVAHAEGLGAYWSTSPLMTHPEVLRWFGADLTMETHVSTIWLGQPVEYPAPPPRKGLDALIRWI